MTSYEMRGKGWAMVIKDWLVYFIIYGRPTNEVTNSHF
jgi:hypothetical protein